MCGREDKIRQSLSNHHSVFVFLTLPKRMNVMKDFYTQTKNSMNIVKKEQLHTKTYIRNKGIVNNNSCLK